MKLEWQCYWPAWWKVWPWWHKSIYDYPEQDMAWNEYYFGISFLQFRVWGKPWTTHLKRSPQYTARLKEILLEDLKSIESRN